MAELGDLPELVRQFRLETVLNQTQTIHTLLRGQRRLPSRVTWERVTERPLGHGGYGEVWLEKRVDDVQDQTPLLRAVKSIYTSASSQRRDYIRELEALAKFSSNSHKYAHFFVQFYGWYESPGRLHAAMEYCEHGDLNKYLKSVGKLTEKEIKDITWQVLGGLSLMHEAKFAHRDVKPANILIKSAPPAEWWVKLCDLGLSKRAEDSASATVMRGTPGFMAPEKLGLNTEDTNGAEETDPFSADMWCLGETISHAVTGHGTFEPHASLYRYASGQSHFPRSSFRKHSVSEECIDFIQSLMSPRPGDRLLANQALLHPWIKAIDDESDLNPIVDVEESLVIPYIGNEQNQHTEASAAWTQETAKSMNHLADQNDENLQISEDDEESATMRMGMDSTVADTTVATERKPQKQLSDSGSHLKVEGREPSRPKSNSEASDPHGSTLMNTTYMEDANEDGNIIEGSKVYADKRRQQPHINGGSVSRNELFKRDETHLYSRPRSPSPVRHGHQTLRQATQDCAVHSRDGQTQDSVDTSPPNHPKVTIRVLDSCDDDRTAQDFDTLTPEYYENAFVTDRDRVLLADAFGNVHVLTRRSNEVNGLDPLPDQDGQETNSSVTDDTSSRSVENEESQYLDWESRRSSFFRKLETSLSFPNLNSFWDEDGSDNDSNAFTSSDRRRERIKAWDQFQKWQDKSITPDNATQYSPSASTISVIDSEDEGTLPYALKRIQRDFPKNWNHHPLGSSHDEIDWHEHHLRFYGKSSRDKPEYSYIFLQELFESKLKEKAATSTHDEQAPRKEVRWDVDPRADNTRPSQRFPIDNMTPQLRGAGAYGNYKLPIPPADDSDGEEERRRLGAHVVDRWLASPEEHTDREKERIRLRAHYVHPFEKYRYVYE